jgi:hypothetical protein
MDYILYSVSDAAIDQEKSDVEQYALTHDTKHLVFKDGIPARAYHIRACNMSQRAADMDRINREQISGNARGYSYLHGMDVFFRRLKNGKTPGLRISTP